MKWKHIRWCEEVRSDWRNKAELKKIDEDLTKKLLAMLFRVKVKMELAKVGGTMRAVTWINNYAIRISYSSSRYIFGSAEEFKFVVDIRFFKKSQTTRIEHLELSHTEKQL